VLWFPAAAGRRVSAASEEGVCPEPATPSDEELLARVQKKDYGAVGVLFDRYAQLFRGIAYRILGDRGEAEGMVQEIFLRLCQKSNTFDPAKGSARTWMVQFAYRRSLYCLRQVLCFARVPHDIQRGSQGKKSRQFAVFGCSRNCGIVVITSIAG
jgi:hypothetical protein